MRDAYLEITYRRGRPLAAYYHLPATGPREVERTRKASGGLVVDFDQDGRALGVEIPAPTAVTLDGFNALLCELNRAPISADEFAPLHAA